MTTWTPEQIDRVRELASQFKSSAQIGDEFKVTRCAIIGLCRRNNIQLQWPSHHYGNNTKRPRRKAQPRPVQSKVSLPPTFLRPKPEEVKIVSSLEFITLLELDMTRQCRWPIGTTSGTQRQQYCGGKREHPSKSAIHCYCAGHAGIAYNGVGREFGVTYGVGK